MWLLVRVMLVAANSSEEEARRLVGLYEETEIILLLALREAVVKAVRSGTPREQQRQLNILLDVAQERLNRVGRSVDAQAARVAALEYEDAVRAVYREVGITPPKRVPLTPQVEVTTAQQTASALRSQHLMVAREVRDVYQRVIASTVNTAMREKMVQPRALQTALNRFADKGVTGFIDQAGRRWGIDVYSDMAVRTMRNNAKQQGHLHGYEATGVELVRASWHPASAPQCVPYQNQLLAITGEAGTRVMTDPATGEKVTVHVKERLDKAIANGYHHPNCKHRDTAYTPGDPTPTVPQVSEEENDRQYEASQRQRQIERNIRKWKKRQAVALDDSEARAAKGKVRQWQAVQRAHVNSHSYLSRLPHREQVRTADRTAR